jgi:hypothetical protein
MVQGAKAREEPVAGPTRDANPQGWQASKRSGASKNSKHFQKEIAYYPGGVPPVDWASENKSAAGVQLVAEILEGRILVATFLVGRAHPRQAILAR